MDNVNQLLEKAKELIDAIGKKTDETIRISKLRATKATLKAELRGTYSKLGGAYYEAKRYDIDKNAEIDQFVAVIDEIIGKIHVLDRSISELSTKTVCKVCGTVNPKSAHYCQHCGALIEAEPYKPQEEPSEEILTEIVDEVKAEVKEIVDVPIEPELKDEE
ncbi:MAG: zinc ribbon domain-containing protein [Oscillospiraceae bacterium]|jgi:hypothetical protein|nr:zinc ribbon domain-containing protein [Oscillospiraceae bacterium]